MIVVQAEAKKHLLQSPPRAAPIDPDRQGQKAELRAQVLPR
jgi:hypothetical protein